MRLKNSEKEPSIWLCWLTFQSGDHNHKTVLPSTHCGCPAWHGQQQIYGIPPESSTSPLGLKNTECYISKLATISSHSFSPQINFIKVEAATSTDHQFSLLGIFPHLSHRVWICLEILASGQSSSHLMQSYQKDHSRYFL